MVIKGSVQVQYIDGIWVEIFCTSSLFSLRAVCVIKKKIYSNKKEDNIFLLGLAKVDGESSFAWELLTITWTSHRFRVRIHIARNEKNLKLTFFWNRGLLVVPLNTWQSKPQLLSRRMHLLPMSQMIITDNVSHIHILTKHIRK